MNFLIFFTMLFGAACAAGLDKEAPIEGQLLEVGTDGNFQNSWTGNGISVQELGSAKPAADNTLGQIIQGEIAYTAPDGTPIKTLYYADENGARFEGAHLPTPPPTPELPPYIARALEWAASHPYKDEYEGKN